MNTELTEQKQINIEKEEHNSDDTKAPKRVLYWEPADDYGLVSRLKVLGGWIIKTEMETLFVTDPNHNWEV